MKKKRAGSKIFSQNSNSEREMKGADGKGMYEEFSAGYYGVCAIGGMLSAGTTHLVITPLDVLKVNMQVFFI